MSRRVLRMSCVALLLLGGALVVLFAYRFCPPARQRALKAGWSGAILKALGVELEADLNEVHPGCLIVANHISWLDIFVINAALPSAFIAKSDVRRWPLIGWLAARNDTIFLQRGNRSQVRQMQPVIADALAAGQHVSIFPEGTTTDGSHVLPFHAALLQPALSAGRPVVPLALSYWERGGQRSFAPRYDGDLSLLASLKTVLACPGLRARLQSTPALGLQGEDRQTIARNARLAVIAASGLSGASLI